VIRLDGVGLSFGDVPVLDGVDLRVEPGEFVGLVGPNGAGKTTLLRTINGALDPDRGEVRLDDSRVGDLGARAVSRRVATVPQDTHVGFSFRAEQIVEMGRTPHRSRWNWGDDHDPVETALERTETTHLRDRRVDDLSGGERQRILLARALAQEPSALLLDEPTASLDVNHQVSVLGLVADLVDDGRAALAAIHDLDLAARFCDRITLLHEGQIRVRGHPERVLNDSSLSAAFDTDAAVTTNPVTGTPTVAALDGRPDRDCRVHVAGSGEGAAAALRTLWRAGFEVTVGPAPEGDVVSVLAEQLDIEAVTAPAFRSPDESLRVAARDLARAADVLVVTGGPGSDAVGGDSASAPRIDAMLANPATAAARVDGGERDAVEDEAELVDAVLTEVQQ